MKKILLLSVIAFITAALLSYTMRTPQPVFLSKECMISCYHTETREMIELDAANPQFVMLHENPRYYKLQDPIGSMTTFKAAQGPDARGYLIKAKKKTNKWLFIIQEWWGLNDYIKKEAETYFAELGDVNVLALDLYDGKVATTQDSAGKYMSTASPARLESIIKGGLALAGTDARIYTVGWCFGGGWSLQTTILAGSQAAGCVMYYGRPENNLDRLKTINCDVIGFFGNKDQGIKPEAVNTFEKNMKDLGKNITVYRYDAGHGFANPSNPSYNKEATEDAHTKAVTFLKEHLKNG